jgi:hypothetical protein
MLGWLSSQAVPAGWLRKDWNLDAPADAAAPDIFAFSRLLKESVRKRALRLSVAKKSAKTSWSYNVSDASPLLITRYATVALHQIIIKKAMHIS